MITMTDLAGRVLVHQAAHMRRMSAARVVACWGANPKAQARAVEVIALLAEHGTPVWCWGTTKNGAPKHPLYLRGNTPLVRFA